MDFAIYSVFANSQKSGNRAVVVRAKFRPNNKSLMALAHALGVTEACAYWQTGRVTEIIFATEEGPIAACGHGLLAVLADCARRNHLVGTELIAYQIVGQTQSIAEVNTRDRQMTQVSAKWFNQPTFVYNLDRCEIAELLSIDKKCIRDDLPLAVFDSGICNGLVPLTSEQVLLNQVRPIGSAWKTYFPKHKIVDLHLYAISGSGDTKKGTICLRTRNLFPFGAQEESATGTASLSLAAALIGKRSFKSTNHFKFRQGIDCEGDLTVDITNRNGIAEFNLTGNTFHLISGSC